METKELIIETAFLAFIENGYDRVSLNSIIKSTGLTKGAFYHYFSSKAELMQEIMDQYFYKHISQTINKIDIEGQSFRDRLRTVYQNVLKVDVTLKCYPDKVIDRNDFLKLFQECMDINDELRLRSVQYQKNVVTAMTKAIEAGTKDGEIKPDLDPMAIGQLLNAAVRGTIITAAAMTKEESEKLLKTNIETIMTLIMI